ncbi:FCD domain-containing protein [Microbacterium sp.]|uniref:FadR/GntR family transcriptional regulator n=1 Tax=Microbacterium sp. TaxID=51671 RepID=UPI0028125713|nr:FCD domain-containing protein [Microbacterium sp.]
MYITPEVATEVSIAAPVTGDLRNLVLDTLGREICSGAIGPETTFTTESIESRFGVSRPVVREALRALEALGLVTPKRRIGVRVLPLTQWNVYDLQVIRWRLAGPSRVAQLRSLTELRGAIEPAAARLAAIRAPLNQASELVGLAGRLWAAGRAGDAPSFLRLDKEFHSLILTMSGNEMFAQLHHLVGEVLTGRTQYELMPRFPAPEALQMHVDIATAIQTGNAEKAASSMVAIMDRTLAEMSSIWDRELDESE